jgi:mono/diheme cytochrome c family protein
LLGGLLLCLAGLALATYLRQDRSFTVPALNLRASKDPAVLERGRYLVNGPAHCADCHGPRNAQERATEPLPLVGGKEFHLPVGTFRVPNITPDRETGIGRYQDEDLARILRYGVRPDGRAVLPFMPFANLSDADLTAVISYLRSTQPVHHEVAPHVVNALGAIVKAWVLEPKGPSGTPAKNVAPEPSVAYGKYLAHDVANCVSCHTKMDMRTGALIGPMFAGGAEHASMDGSGRKFMSPNLTPDARWGWIQGWSEDTFVARFKAGTLREGSPMPWPAFRNMSESDVRAVYRYLRSLPAAPGGPDPKVVSSVVVAAQ